MSDQLMFWIGCANISIGMVGSFFLGFPQNSIISTIIGCTLLLSLAISKRCKRGN